MIKDKLTPVEVAEEIGVTPVTVRNWIKTGKLPGMRVGGRLFIRRDDLDRFLSGPVYPGDKEAAAGDKPA